MRDDLIERLEKATEQDRHLDAEIASAIGWAPGPGYRRCSDNSWRMVLPGRTESDAINSVTWPPSYTASIDAALTLMPEDFTFYVDSGTNNGGDHCHACVWHPNPDNKRTSGGARHATSPALALCIAALKARATLTAGQRAE